MSGPRSSVRACAPRRSASGLFGPLFIGWIAIAATGLATAQTVLYVDDDAAAGGDGSSWTAALRYLQDALDAARNSDGAVTEIRVAQGTYRPDEGQNVTPGDPAAFFALVDGVAIRGGYASLGAADPDERDVEAYQTTLSGDLNGDDVPGDPWSGQADNSVILARADNLAEDTSLDGLTLSGGKTGLRGENSRLVVNRCVFSQGYYGLESRFCPSLTIRDCTFQKHFTTAVYDSASTVTMERTVITGLGQHYAAYSQGPGIQCGTSNLTLSECVITQFIRPGSGSTGGGGIQCYRTNAVILNSVISDNTKAGSTLSVDGGGIYCNGGTLMMDGCVVTRNYGDNGAGIGLYNECDAVIRNTTISHNRMDSSLNWQPSAGGGLNASACNDITLENCQIIGNQARGQGGGAYVYLTRNTSVNGCIISGNTSGFAYAAGGLWLYPRDADSTARVTNCGVSENRTVFTHPSYPGMGGLYSLGAVSIENSIFWGNESDDGFQLGMAGSSAAPSLGAVDHCVIQGGQAAVYTNEYATLAWGDDNLDADPLFVSPGHLDDNGIPGLSFEDRWVEGDYHLLPGSPCIDAGTNTPHGDAANLPAADLDGVPRPQDGDDDGEAVADIGAYEKSLTIPVIAATPAMLEVTSPTGGPNPPPQILTIRNIGGGMLNWALTEACDWLEAVPAAGQSTGEANQVILTINAAGLAHGDHACTLTVSDPQAPNSPREVTLTQHATATLRVPAEYPTIQAAVDDAVKGDVVLVADGTYTGDGNRDIDFLGKAITVRSENGPATTIIDCQGSDGDDHRGFLFFGQEGPDSVLEGFTITNGYASHWGGAVYCSRSHPTIRNCIMTGCRAGSGGGLYLDRSAASITGCTFSGNVAEWDGAGVHSEWSYITLANCRVVGNQIASGVSAREGRLSVVNCTFNENRPYAVTSANAQLTLLNSILWGGMFAPEKSIRILDEPSLALEHTIAWCDIYRGLSAVDKSAGTVINWGPGNINADPLFVAIGDWDNNGTPASDDDFWVDGNYHLQPGSPCIDAGSNAAVPVGVATDLDGRPRFVDDPATPDTGEGTPPIVDMGPYEYAPPPPDFNTDGTVDVADLEHFEECATGPAVGPPADGCADADLDRDGDIDQCDFGLFQRWLGWTGPSGPEPRHE